MLVEIRNIRPHTVQKNCILNYAAILNDRGTLGGLCGNASIEVISWLGVQVGANAHVSDLAYADDILILSSSYSEVQGVFEAINRHAAAVGVRISASKTKVMSALIPDGQRQTLIPSVELRRRLPEDMGYHDQGRPGTGLRTASLRPPKMEKWMGESL